MVGQFAPFYSILLAFCFVSRSSQQVFLFRSHVECCDGRWMVQILNTIHVTTKAHFELVCSDFVYVRDFILTDEAVILLLTLLIVSRSYSHTPLSCFMKTNNNIQIICNDLIIDAFIKNRTRLACMLLFFEFVIWLVDLKHGSGRIENGGGTPAQAREHLFCLRALRTWAGLTPRE